MKEVGKKCSKGIRRGAGLQTPNRAANILWFCSLDVNNLLSVTVLERQTKTEQMDTRVCTMGPVLFYFEKVPDLRLVNHVPKQSLPCVLPQSSLEISIMALKTLV